MVLILDECVGELHRTEVLETRPFKNKKPKELEYFILKVQFIAT